MGSTTFCRGNTDLKGKSLVEIHVLKLPTVSVETSRLPGGKEIRRSRKKWQVFFAFNVRPFVYTECASFSKNQAQHKMKQIKLKGRILHCSVVLYNKKQDS